MTDQFREFTYWLGTNEEKSPATAVAYTARAKQIVTALGDNPEIDLFDTFVAERSPMQRSLYRVAWRAWIRFKEAQGVTLRPLPSQAVGRPPAQIGVRPEDFLILAFIEQSGARPLDVARIRWEGVQRGANNDWAFRGSNDQRWRIPHDLFEEIKQFTWPDGKINISNKPLFMGPSKQAAITTDEIYRAHDRAQAAIMKGTHKPWTPSGAPPPAAPARQPVFMPGPPPKV